MIIYKTAQQTCEIRKMLHNNSKLPSWFWNDLFDESNLQEDKIGKILPRIGVKYQATKIPKYNTEHIVL